MTKGLRQRRATGRSWWSGAVWVLLAWAVLARVGAGQDLRYLRHQTWTTEDGLPQDSVHAVAQTRDGYVWVGTERGLARYDGAGFQVFDRGTDAAFGSDDICCMVAGEDGGLWVGTADGVVRVWDGGARSERFGVAQGLPSAGVERMENAGGGGLLVETAAGWAAWRGGRFVPVRESARGTAEQQLPGGGDGWSATDAAVRLAEGGGGRVWSVGERLPGSRVESFVAMGRSAWVGTNVGLFLLRADGGVEAVPALRGDAVLVLLRDGEGDLWVGTESSGLHVLRPVEFRTEPGVTGDGVVAVVESEGTVWVGTRRDGVRRLRGGAVQVISPREMTSPVVLSLAPASGGGVWVGTPDGLNRVTGEGRVQLLQSAEGLPDDYVLALAGDGAGGVWAGTRRGLAHVGSGMEETAVLTRSEGLPGDLVGSLLRTRVGELWVATSGGLSRRGTDGVFRGVPTKPGRGLVRTMAEAADGAVWLATSEGWVSRVQGGVVERLAMPVVSGAVDGVVVDGDVVFLRTDDGVESMRQEEFARCAREGCRPTVTEYGVADGMPSAEVVDAGQPVAWRMSDGEIWFGTRHGVAILKAGADVGGETAAPPVVIERFAVDGTTLGTRDAGVGGQPIAVPYGRVRFTVEYAGLSFRAPGKVRYRYRLEGMDSGWTDAGGRRLATYTNLRPGRYRFEVEAAIGDGPWGEPGAELRFRVIPPVYRRWWFVLLMGLVAAALVAGVYLLRLRRLRREFAAVLGERNRMAREIHDTLAQDFVGVSLKLDIALQLLGMGKQEAAAEQMRETRVLVTEGLQEARQSIWGLRANVSADSLPARLTKAVERLREDGLAVRLRVGGAYRRLDSRVEAEVLRVGQEAMQNARRHAGVTEASVELDYRRDMLVLTVEDRGRGFVLSEAQRMEGHYGVRGMEERAAAVGGELEVRSVVGEGTRVQLRCPIAGREVEAERE